MNSPRGAKGTQTNPEESEAVSPELISGKPAPDPVADPDPSAEQPETFGNDEAEEVTETPKIVRARQRQQGGRAGARKAKGGNANVPATVEQETMPARMPPRQLPARVKKGPPKGPAAPKLSQVSTAPVPPARIRRRHRLLIASFFLMVILPAIGVFYYLYEHAQDRYNSTTAFFVHREDAIPSVETAFGLPNVAGPSGTPDADVLYQFIQSQTMVELADARLDLRARYSPYHDVDPVFSLAPDAPLEDLVSYWERVVLPTLSGDIGLITLEVIAFDPDDAQALATVILEESAALIDRLSQIARDDAITQAQEELSIAEERLRGARIAVAEFRSSSQFVDPSAVVAGSEGVITALEQRLAQEMIERDTLVGTTTRADDPRLERADRTIQAIRDRIEAERATVGTDDATAVGAYEELLVDRQFAETAYTTALAAYDAAVAEARRKSRYLATHISPTRADTPVYPQRIVLGLLGTGVLFGIWAIMMLVLYSIYDRR